MDYKIICESIIEKIKYWKNETKKYKKLYEDYKRYYNELNDDVLKFQKECIFREKNEGYTDEWGDFYESSEDSYKCTYDGGTCFNGEVCHRFNNYDN